MITHSIRRHNRLSHRIASTISFTALLAALAHAQGGGPTKNWVQVEPGAPEGTKAIIDVVEAQSNSNQTVVDVSIQGFWRETVFGSDGLAYDRFEFPGLSNLGVVGDPELGAVTLDLAIGSSATQVSIAQVLTNLAYEQTGYVAYPTPFPETESNNEQGGDTIVPEQFMKNAATYATDAFYPSGPTSFPVEFGAGGVHTSHVRLAPVTYNPTQQKLRVLRGVRYVLAHSGLPLSALPIPKDLSKLKAAESSNWPSASNSFQANVVEYKGRYLIVAKSAWVPQLAEFIAYRKACGYQVNVRTLESIPTQTPAAIRQAIKDWYVLGQADQVHFCMLVGTHEVIPHDLSPTAGAKKTDDLYGSMNGDDFDKEVFVGRLPVDKSEEIAPMLGKIISYETKPNLNEHYERALVVAHDEGGPNGEFQPAVEVAVNADYAVDPTFIEVYGASIFSTNQMISDTINSGVGIAAYRGHGSTSSWYHWNLFDESWANDEVNGLLNYSIPSVFWNIDCANHGVGTTNNHGERILKQVGRGGVSSYGCSSTSGRKQNHALFQNLFYAVFDKGITCQSQAIQFAEKAMMNLYPEGENAWCYNLYGDPAMRIRRDAPKAFDVTFPPIVESCVGPSCFLSINVKDASGAPAAGVMVGAYKAGSGFAAGDETFANTYTDANGDARLPMNAQTLGTLRLVVRDDEGNSQQVEIPVKVGPFTDLGNAKLGAAGLPSLTGTGLLVAGTPATIDLTNAAPNSAALILLSTSDAPTPFMGGVLHPIPVLASIPLMTSAVGDAHLPISQWPSLVPGFAIVMQTAIADPAATNGVSLSNGLRAEQQ